MIRVSSGTEVTPLKVGAPVASEATAQAGHRSAFKSIARAAVVAGALSASALLGSGCALHTTPPTPNCSVNGGNNLGQLPKCEPGNSGDIPVTSASNSAPEIKPSGKSVEESRLLGEGIAITSLLGITISIFVKRRYYPSSNTMIRTNNERKLRRLSNSSNIDIVSAVAGNSSTPQDVLERLANHPDMHVVAEVAGNWHAGPKALAHIGYTKADETVLLALARNSRTLKDTLIALSKHSNMRIAVSAAFTDLNDTDFEQLSRRFATLSKQDQLAVVDEFTIYIAAQTKPQYEGGRLKLVRFLQYGDEEVGRTILSKYDREVGLLHSEAERSAEEYSATLATARREEEEAKKIIPSPVREGEF